MSDKPIILMVDDSTMDIQILISIFKEDYNIRIAKNGLIALDLIYNGLKPNLILLDVMMPVMNGYEFIKEFKQCKVCVTCPVIFMTVNNTPEDEEKAFAMGGVDYIKKPFSKAIVKARVKTHITLARQKDEILYHTSRDPLTNLYNLEHFIQEGERKFTRSSRHSTQLSLILIEIDNIAEINEKNSYIAGYKVLREVATSLMLEHRRTEDFLAKFTGDKFALILEECDNENTKIKANEIVEMVAKLKPENIRTTVSVGVCTYSKAYKDFEYFFKDAQEALDMARTSGGNRVVLFTDEEL